MKLSLKDLVINYELYGAGKSLTLIHGVGDNLNIWYNQVPVFSKYFSVLAYDVRGHGLSGLTEEVITTKILAEDLHSLLTALNIQETLLLGHSMGGRIAISFALKHPEMVRALVLCSCVGPGPKAEDVLKTIEDVKREGLEGVIKEKLNRTFSPGFIEKHPELIEKYRRILHKTDVKAYLRFMQPLIQPEKTITDYSYLNKISCPTMIIVGGNDPVCAPASGREAQQAIPGAKLEILPTGHTPALERPEEFNKIVLSFLTQFT